MPDAKVPYLPLQESPLIYVAIVQGKWLYAHSTPSLRIKDPQRGFQRLVDQKRARVIARNVLESHHTLPNAIIVAGRERDFPKEDGKLVLPDKTSFLVVDGQHRLNASLYSDYNAPYAVIIHLGLSREGMANLFLEINENQKRVPASLRWDLYRLIRPADDEFKIVAAEIVFELATRMGSPLLQRIDLTGEQPKIKLTQATIAPEIRRIVASKKLPLREIDFEAQLTAYTTYLSAIRSLDPDRWDVGESDYYQPKVMRGLFRLFGDFLEREKRPIGEITSTDYAARLEKIDTDEIQPEVLRRVGGTAGVKAIYDTMKRQVFGR
jgi:DGQHR domain-containing protein